MEDSILELFKIRVGKELENLVRINSVLTKGWTSRTGKAFSSLNWVILKNETMALMSTCPTLRVQWQ